MRTPAKGQDGEKSASGSGFLHGIAETLRSATQFRQPLPGGPAWLGTPSLGTPTLGDSLKRSPQLVLKHLRGASRDVRAAQLKIWTRNRNGRCRCNRNCPPRLDAPQANAFEGKLHDEADRPLTGNPKQSLADRPLTAPGRIRWVRRSPSASPRPTGCAPRRNICSRKPQSSFSVVPT